MENEVVESTTNEEVVESTTNIEEVEEVEVSAEDVQEVDTTALDIPKMQNIAINLFGESKRQAITSLDLNNEEDADMLLNASQEADFKLNDEIGKEITVIGCSLTETPVETMDEQTGEVITRKKHTVCLFDIDGQSHVTGSNACYSSFMQIIAFKGMPTRERPLVLVPVKAPAKEQGHSYLRLKVKTNK